VWSVTHRVTKDTRAVKIVKKSLVKQYSRLNDLVMSEFESLSSMDSPNIMKIFEIFEDPHKYYIVTDHMKGPTLMQHFATLNQEDFTEKKVAGIIKQLLSALCHCHSKGVIHRDVKPDNLMFVDADCKHLKLIDFGFAKLFAPQDCKIQEVLGSPIYMAPEICDKVEYDAKADIWSAGIVTYLLLSGEVPYDISEATDLAKLFVQIRKKVFTLDTLKGEAWDEISPEAKKFCISMLNKDPKLRPTAETLLKDPWLENARVGPIGKDKAKNLLGNMNSCTVFFFNISKI